MSIPPLREIARTFRITRPLHSKQHQPCLSSRNGLYSPRTIALIFLILLFVLSSQDFNRPFGSRFLALRNSLWGRKHSPDEANISRTAHNLSAKSFLQILSNNVNGEYIPKHNAAAALEAKVHLQGFFIASYFCRVHSHFVPEGDQIIDLAEIRDD